MLTQTSESAIRALIYLAYQKDGEPIPPRQIAEYLQASPTYMAKITRMLVKAGILRSHRGALGGVSLNRTPRSISLLEIVEACQGLIVGNYCEGLKDHPEPVCAFHQAMVEVQSATVGVLSRWTLADMVARPGPSAVFKGKLPCRMGFQWPTSSERKG